MITLITCTGLRPEAFKLCKQYVKRMADPSLDRYQWIIVDDGDSDYQLDSFPGHIKYLKGPRPWKPGFNTHRFNMEVALANTEGDYIFIIEDDDWYHPDYIRVFYRLLKEVKAVGILNNKYYSVAIPGYKNMANPHYSSLCSTALTKEALPLLSKAVDSGELFFDIAFWTEVKKAFMPYIFTSNKDLVVGIKNLPGRDGIGIGHKQKDYLYDSKLVKLKELVGDDFNNYLPFIKQRG